MKSETEIYFNSRKSRKTPRSKSRKTSRRKTRRKSRRKSRKTSRRKSRRKSRRYKMNELKPPEFKKIIQRGYGDKIETEIVPYKAKLECWYYDNRSIMIDILLIVLTALLVIFPDFQLHNVIFSDLPRHRTFNS